MKQDQIETYNPLKKRGYKELSRKLDQMERDREQWEREALKNIDQELDDSGLASLRSRHFVRQSYDSKLSKGGKEKLEEILQKEKQQNSLKEEIKKMREEKAKKRKEKLKKLKIL